MAEGGFSILNQPIDQFIQCIHHYMFFEIDNSGYRAVSSAEYYLDSISDTAAGNEYFDECYFDTAIVSCKISCPHCDKDFETVAQVSASPIWNYDDILEGKAPRICHFEDVEILKVSMSFEKTNSIQECYKWYIDNEYPEDFELNAQIGIAVVPSSIIILKIIAKTKMSKGFCYLGLQENTGHIFRPIFNTSNQQCCWPTNAELMFGMLYTFYVIVYPNPIKYFTPFPHRNEDMIVSGFGFFGVSIPNHLNYPTFSHLAKNDVRDIFKDIKKKRYVNENTKCSSVGILRSSALIAFNPFKQKYYCKLKCKSGVYVLPITATQYTNIGISYTDAVIVLGLGRPYKGKNDEHDPARCYLLVVGIYLPSGQIALSQV